MRISRQDMLTEIALTVARRSTCVRRQVGAVIHRGGRVLTLGYNGSPSNTPHCIDEGCIIDPVTGACLRAVHAEASAISWAAKEGIALEGSQLLTTVSPCMACAQIIINSGIYVVRYLEEYRDTRPIEYLREADLLVEKIESATKSEVPGL